MLFRHLNILERLWETEITAMEYEHNYTQFLYQSISTLLKHAERNYLHYAKKLDLKRIMQSREIVKKLTRPRYRFTVSILSGK